MILPKSVKQIGSGIFDGTSKITQLKLLSGNVQIDANIFKGCDNINLILSEDIENVHISLNSLGKTIYYEGDSDAWDLVEGSENITSKVCTFTNGCVHGGDLHWKYSNGNIETITQTTIGEFVIDNLPDCNSKGLKHAYCNYCQENIYYEIPVLGHKIDGNSCVICHEVFNCNISVDETYPFVFNDEYNAYINTNQDVHRSTSSMTITATTNIRINFRYKVSTENGYDFLYIKKNGTTILKLSGEVIETEVSFELNVNDVLLFQYTKDQAVSSFDDSVYISGLLVENI